MKQSDTPQDAHMQVSLQGRVFNGVSFTQVDEQEKQMNASKRRLHKHGISLRTLKILGAIAMVFSVLGVSVLPTVFGGISRDNMTALTVAIMCELLSWVAIPWYAWLLVRGYRYTHNVWHYAFRLLMLAIICEVPYDKVTSGKFVDFSSQNPVFGLVVALVVLIGIDMVHKQWHGRAKKIAVVGIILAGCLWTMFGNIGVRQRVLWGGTILLVFVLIFALLERHEIRMELFAGMFGAMSLVAPGIGVAILHYRNRSGDEAKPSNRMRACMYAWYPLLLVVAMVISCLH